MKTEEQVYNEVLDYIKGPKHNRPCTLASIKRVLRSQRVVDLIFSRPDIFKLESEITHVPQECLTEAILVKYILSDPKYFESLDESLQTLPVLVAFEFSKRRYECISKYYWGSCAEKIPYTGKILEHCNSISDICDEVLKKISNNPEEGYLLRDYVVYIETASTEILNYCSSHNKKLEKEEKYVPKYFGISFDIEERLFIFVSGRPDTGKTTFSNILSSRIQNSVHIDSDVLLERNLLCTPLPNLINDKIKVVIFSDIYADRFFKKEELGNARVINILMEPISIEAMHRNSKFMSHIPFEEYKENEIEKIRYDFLENPIVVINNYKGKMSAEADKVLEQISQRLGVSLSVAASGLLNSEQTITSTLKKTLKPICTSVKE